MNLVTLIGNVKSIIDLNNNKKSIEMLVDDNIFKLNISEDKFDQSLQNGDIIGVIGRINKENIIDIKHLSKF